MNITINTKVCSRCGVKKIISKFGRDITKKDKLRFWCLECHRDYISKYGKVEVNKMRHNNLRRIRRKNNPRTITQAQKECMRRWLKKGRDTLSNYYIKQLLHNKFKKMGIDIAYKDIPLEIIELKRKKIQINRLLKQ